VRTPASKVYVHSTCRWAIAQVGFVAWGREGREEMKSTKQTDARPERCTKSRQQMKQRDKASLPGGVPSGPECPHVVQCSDPGMVVVQPPISWGICRELQYVEKATAWPQVLLVPDERSKRRTIRLNLTYRHVTKNLAT